MDQPTDNNLNPVADNSLASSDPPSNQDTASIPQTAPPVVFPQTSSPPPVENNIISEPNITPFPSASDNVSSPLIGNDSFSSSASPPPLSTMPGETNLGMDNNSNIGGLGFAQDSSLSGFNVAPVVPEQTSIAQDPPMPAWPPQPQSSTSPVSTSTPPDGISQSFPQSAPVVPPEPAPTDLSHLVENTENTTPAPPVVDESLVVPQLPDAASVAVAGSSGGFPKWLLIVGGLVLAAVMAGSAYFILGIGSSSVNTPALLPAEQVPAPPPSQQGVAPSSMQMPAVPATSSSNLGALQGLDASNAAIPSISTPPSALERLKQQSSTTTP
ncbi:MAG: hypothetical protein C4584_01590 [Armatimonadetes bacterium]|nr:MAG: hypothetical protein C4584_01590 [Armatimonadota bacterium]